MAKYIRHSVIVLAEPKCPDAPPGICRWCGNTLVGKRASIRRYCYKDREGKDCVAAYRWSVCWNARIALLRMAAKKGELRCTDCKVLCERWAPRQSLKVWQADHHIPLADGGTHTIDNLRCRCDLCHREKTIREAKARALDKL